LVLAAWTAALVLVSGVHPGSARAAESFTSTTVGPVRLSPTQMPVTRVTPELFGAKGDGKSDDTAAIQAALDNANGATVWLGPNKTYLVTKSLVLPDNTTLEGDGPHSVLKFNWFDGSGSNSGGKFYLYNEPGPDGASKITVSNFVLVGGGDGTPSGPNDLYPNDLTCGIRLNHVNGFSATHLEIEDTPAFALGEFGSQNGQMEYNYIHNVGRGGIGMWWQQMDTQAVTVSHNNVDDAGDDAIAINGLPLQSPWNSSALPANIEISDNDVVGWSSNVNGRALGRGVALFGVTGVTVENNSFTNTYGDGILVSGCNQHFCPDGSGNLDPTTGQPWWSSNLQVLNNTITNAGDLYAGSTLNQNNVSTDGIYIATTNGAIVTGNTIQNPAGAPIDDVSCNGCTIQ
jgi:hypothetical protein